MVKIDEAALHSAPFPFAYFAVSNAYSKTAGGAKTKFLCVLLRRFPVKTIRDGRSVSITAAARSQQVRGRARFVQQKCCGPVPKRVSSRNFLERVSKDEPRRVITAHLDRKLKGKL